MTGFLPFASGRLGPSEVTLRPALPADAELIVSFLAAARAPELAHVAWTEQQKQAFVRSQSGLQEADYARNYAGAERLVIERGAPIGRIYVHTAPGDVHLMDVTLLDAHRMQGIGTRLLALLVEYADSLGRSTSLFVEPFNPAKRMYSRAGFTVRSSHGVYEYMVRPREGNVS